MGWAYSFHLRKRVVSAVDARDKTDEKVPELFACGRGGSGFALKAYKKWVFAGPCG
jgi:hypothetical protein